MKILALDLGTTIGWAIANADDAGSPDWCKLVTSGAENFKPKRFEGGGMRYLRFKQWLTEIKGLGGLDMIVYEEVRRHLSTDSAHAYGGFMATLTAWCEHHKIPYMAVPVQTIKIHATGKGNANKAAMVEACHAAGFSPEDDNEADAIHMLGYAVVNLVVREAAPV